MLMKLTTGDPHTQFRHNGVNFINVLRAAFAHSDPKSTKKTDNMTAFFCTFGIFARKSFA